MLLREVRAKMLTDIFNDLKAQSHYEIGEYQLMTPQLRRHTALIKFTAEEDCNNFKSRFHVKDEPILAPDGSNVFAS